MQHIVAVMQVITLEMQLKTRMTEPTQTKFEQRKCMLTCIETCKLNAAVMYNDSDVEKLASVMASKLDIFPDLREYVEDFRRKCVKSHREQAKKRLMAFYFNRCEDLCDDMIWEILQRV